MEFIRFDSIKHNGNEEFIHSKNDRVIALEKLDGMNVSVTKEYVAGRNKPIPLVNHGYRGWAKEGRRIQEIIAEKYILFGEWLVPHTVDYKEEFIFKFYLFAAINKETMIEVDWETVKTIANEIGVSTPNVVFEGEYLELEKQLENLVGKSELTKDPEKGEGIVILNLTQGFRTKIVTDYFRERAKASFKEERLLHVSESQSWATEYGTSARIRKTIHKLLDEEIILEEDLLLQKFNYIRELVNEYTFKDMLDEAEEFPEVFLENEAKKHLNKEVVHVIKEFLK